MTLNYYDVDVVCFTGFIQRYLFALCKVMILHGPKRKRVPIDFFISSLCVGRLLLTFRRIVIGYIQGISSVSILCKTELRIFINNLIKN